MRPAPKAILTFIFLRNSMMKLRYALPLIGVLAFVSSTPTQAKLDADHVNQELSASSRAVNEGHVKGGIEALTKLLRSIDPEEDKEAYWRTSTLLIELLSQLETHSLATQVINALIATKIPQTQTAYLQWTQYFVGRNLAWTGNRDEGEKVLRVLTAADARQVSIPAQRAAAL